MYVCLYVCLYATKLDLNDFNKIQPYNFFILGTTKEAINTYQIVKTAFRLMYLAMCFGPFLGPNWPKNEHFDIFLDNGAIENINTSQLAKTASKLIHFSRSYGPKRV